MVTNKVQVLLMVAAMALATTQISCQKNGDEPFMPDFPGGPTGPGQVGGMMGGNVVDDTSAPDFDAVIHSYNGEKATDASADVVGSDADFYHEANDFSTVVEVKYDGAAATVNSQSAKVLSHVSGAHVVIDMLTNSVKNVKIVLSGKTDDGSLKIYGEKKFMLALNGVDITSTKGPAINSQCKKRVFVHLEAGTENSLKDSGSYADDIYYPEGVAAADEDRKGCFFSEGNMIFSGTGVLKVAGLKKHGIVTDGYFWMRPGVTIAITEAAKNALHVKGDDTDQIGVTINGGLLYCNVASDAGKGIKTDMMVNINGGQLLLNTSGKSIYDEEEKDTSSASCIKADGDITIAGGELTLKSTGMGGKGISTDAALHISGGNTTITTTGGKYEYTKDLTASPKGVKADGDIDITGGKLNISVTGVSDGSEGLESKANLTISGGDVYVYAYDDAINAGNSITINAGTVFCHAVNNDGIDSNGTLTINGGTVIASGTNVPEASFDSDDSRNFVVTGGTLIGIGGTGTSPSTSSTQKSVLYGGLTAAKGVTLSVVNSNKEQIMSYKLHRTLTGLTLFMSSPKLQNGSYTVKGNESELGTFTVSGVVTTVGNVSGGGGGQGGGPTGPGGGGTPGGGGPGGGGPAPGQ